MIEKTRQKRNLNKRATYFIQKSVACKAITCAVEKGKYIVFQKKMAKLWSTITLESPRKSFFTLSILLHSSPSLSGKLTNISRIYDQPQPRSCPELHPPEHVLSPYALWTTEPWLFLLSSEQSGLPCQKISFLCSSISLEQPLTTADVFRALAVRVFSLSRLLRVSIKASLSLKSWR